MKKEKLEALELEHQKLRKEYLGNICFIGELFKLDFLTEKIMHGCILNTIENRSAIILLKAIQSSVLPCSVIMSYC